MAIIIPINLSTIFKHLNFVTFEAFCKIKRKCLGTQRERNEMHESKYTKGMCRFVCV